MPQIEDDEQICQLSLPAPNIRTMTLRLAADKDLPTWRVAIFHRMSDRDPWTIQSQSVLMSLREANSHSNLFNSRGEIFFRAKAALDLKAFFAATMSELSNVAGSSSLLTS